ncbi:hypothetical protein BGZ83_002101 [Gryganskiella cystojenkinii]|nr:hypothetical protein BGZ83_002101 [Gryganskiella cystojenkinii]
MHRPTKDELLLAIQEANIPPKYTIYEHAKNGDHVIMKTPPYHCELQPIEKIWGVAKNQVAANATGKHDPLTLKKNLERLFVQMPQSVFISVWLKSIRKAQAYEREGKKTEKISPPVVPPGPNTNDLLDQDQDQEPMTIHYFIGMNMRDEVPWMRCLQCVGGLEDEFAAGIYSDPEDMEADMDARADADVEEMMLILTVH